MSSAAHPPLDAQCSPAPERCPLRITVTAVRLHRYRHHPSDARAWRPSQAEAGSQEAQAVSFLLRLRAPGATARQSYGTLTFHAH
eukprot:3254123-Prymnesium_polylepis.1